MRFRALSLFVVLLSAVAVASCSEDISAGQNCPLLCPQPDPPLLDTLIDAVTFDTSVAGFPPLGFESMLLLSRQGDSLDAAVVTRFDSIQTHFSIKGQDSVISHVDSAFIRAIRVPEDSLDSLKADATVEVYDVTDASPDTVTASLMGQMTATNKIGSIDLAKGSKPDTLTVQVDTARVRSRIVNGHRMRIALRMVTATSAQIRLVSQDAGGGIVLTVRPSRDSSAETLTISPNSDTASSPVPTVAAALADFSAVLSLPPGGSNLLRVGGYPARRVLMRFRIPSTIIDSSAVIRATLFLTQNPSTAPTSGDTTGLFAVPIVVSGLVTDVHLALEFAASPGVFTPDSVRLVPRDSGRREIDIVRILRAWHGQDTSKTPRAIALVMDNEGKQTAALDFFSMEAPVGLRPQLRITYATKPSSGRP